MDKLACDPEPYSKAPLCAVSIQAPKPLENLRLVLIRDANPFIANGQSGVALIGFRGGEFGVGAGSAPLMWQQELV